MVSISKDVWFFDFWCWDEFFCMHMVVYVLLRYVGLMLILILGAGCTTIVG